MLKIKDAKEELSTKSYNQIQTETAWRWASRAAAMFEIVLAGPNENKGYHLSVANSFFSEAVEHAAEVSSALVQEVMDQVNPYQATADAHIEGLLKGVQNV